MCNELDVYVRDAFDTRFCKVKKKRNYNDIFHGTTTKSVGRRERFKEMAQSAQRPVCTADTAADRRRRGVAVTIQRCCWWAEAMRYVVVVAVD